MSHKARILYIVPSAGVGGAETFLLHSARFHGEYDPIYLCFRSGPLVAELRAAGRVVETLDFIPRLRNPFSVFMAVKAIHKIARKHEVALVHSTMAYGAIFGAVAAALARLPHVWFQHGPVSGWLDRVAAFFPARATLVNSQYTGTRQLSYGRNQRIVYVRLGVDLDKVDASLLAPTLPESNFVIGTVCRPQPQKGLEQFVRAIAEVSKKSRVRGVILGGDGSEYQLAVQSLIDHLKAPVTILPETSNPFPIMRGFDLLVSAAVKPEAFGLTLLEGMALGIPALAPAEGGPIDFVKNLFRPRDEADLARAMSEAAGRPRAFDYEAAEKVRYEYSAHRCTEQLESIYSEILR